MTEFKKLADVNWSKYNYAYNYYFQKIEMKRSQNVNIFLQHSQ